jgi:crotonobetainyl-CoA:carnitine CoA-transferase CaiB-like acyl-CoA transferase
MYSCVAILAALHERQSSGVGQYIDMALLDSQVAWLANQNTNYLIGGAPPKRMGNAHPNIVPYQTFHTRDGDMILAVGNDNQFRKFCVAAGIPDVAEDPRFLDNIGRTANRQACVDALAVAIKQKTTAEWVALLEPIGVPCGPINRLDEVYADPQVQHRGMKIEVPHPLSGVVPLVANPIKYSRTPISYDAPPPLLGQHTEEVLSTLLGKTTEEIAALRATRIV